MKPVNKIILSFEIIAFAFIFLLTASPVLASEINGKNVIELVNEAREKQNLAPFSENVKLTEIARDKINDMIEKNYFAHTSPSGVTPWVWYQKEKYDYKYAGENLAINFMTAEDQMKAWMDSPTHRKNILNSNFREIGVAVAVGKINGQNAIIAVQEFGTQVGAPALADNGKNFSGKEKTNLVKEDVKITPQVLASKDSNFKSGNNSSPNMNNSGFQIVAIELFQAVAVFITMLMIALTPLAFLAVAFDRILALNKKRKYLAHAK